MYIYMCNTLNVTAHYYQNDVALSVPTLKLNDGRKLVQYVRNKISNGIIFSEKNENCTYIYTMSIMMMK